jgi:C4-dicarboxylate transporter, DctQ subunit
MTALLHQITGPDGERLSHRPSETSLFSFFFWWLSSFSLGGHMFVWMAKFGAALGVRTGIHVGVDVFVNRLTPAARKPVIVFAMLCGALFTGVIGTLGAVYVYRLDPDQVSPELEWPSWIIYLAIPLGSYLMCFRFLQVMWRFLRTGKVPHPAHGVDYEAPHDTTPPAAVEAAR